MSNCFGCKSNHVSGDNSWSGLKRGNATWEGFCGGYTTTEQSWTRAKNIAPPSARWVKGFQPTREGFSKPPAHAENFCFGCHSTYSNLEQTWKKQSPYTLN